VKKSPSEATEAQIALVTVVQSCYMSTAD